MTGYVTPDLMDPTQPYRRRSRFELPTNMLDPSQQPAQPDADLLAPAQADTSAPAAEPTVQGPTEQPPSSGPDYDREISQAYGRFRDRSAQFDQAMQGFDQLRSQAPNPHRSVIGRIAEGIVSSLSPAAGRAIWEEPYERKLGAYQSQVGAQEKQLGVLHQATQDELADVRAQQQGKRTDAYYDWMSRRQTQGAQHDPRTVQVEGPDGMPHLMQFNPQSGRYDIDAGKAHEKEPAVHNENDISLFNRDPDAFSRYETTKAKINRQYGPRPASDRPTSDEFKLNLLKTDPQRYQAIYGDKGQAVDTKLMTIARESAKDELGEIDQDKMQRIYDQLVAKQQQTSAARMGTAPTQPAPAAGAQTIVNRKTGQRMVLKGGQWVPAAGAR